MTFSLRRVNAIFQKDFKDLSRNMAVSMVLFLPPILAAVYGRMGLTTIESHYMIINMTFALVATYVQCCLIAEEKEKNTLRGLMLSPATIAEILSGKSALTFVLTIFVVVFSAFLSEYRPSNVLYISIAILLSALFYLAVGTILGLVAKSVMESSVIVLPVIVIFSFGSAILNWVEQYPILKVAEYMPNVQLIQLANEVENGASFVDILSPLGIIAAWVGVAAVMTVIVFRKRMVD